MKIILIPLVKNKTEVSENGFKQTWVSKYWDHL